MYLKHLASKDWPWLSLRHQANSCSKVMPTLCLFAMMGSLYMPPQAPGGVTNTNCLPVLLVSSDDEHDYSYGGLIICIEAGKHCTVNAQY